jgi:hypothetical protein
MILAVFADILGFIPRHFEDWFTRIPALWIAPFIVTRVVMLEAQWSDYAFFVRALTVGCFGSVALGAVWNVWLGARLISKRHEKGAQDGRTRLWGCLMGGFCGWATFGVLAFLGEAAGILEPIAASLGHRLRARLLLPFLCPFVWRELTLAERELAVFSLVLIMAGGAIGGLWGKRPIC